MPIKQQFTEINWLRQLASAVTTGAVVFAMLLAVAKLWGDSLWVNQEQAAKIATQVAVETIEQHENRKEMHPPATEVADRLDRRYVPIVQFQSLEKRIDRFESVMITELRALRPAIK